MDIRARENELFERWKQERDYPYFIRDGVFNPSVWKNEKIKITFVLKEANWENEDADLRDWIMSEVSSTYWKTWNNIARWTKAIIEGGPYPHDISRADKTYWLSKISFLNLKKVGGDARAENDTIREYAIRDASYISEQLSLYQPDIIICCGRGDGKNADLLYEEILTTTSPWQEPIDGFNYFYTTFDGKSIRTPVISFFHPQRIASHSTYQAWYENIRKIGRLLLKH